MDWRRVQNREWPRAFCTWREDFISIWRALGDIASMHLSQWSHFNTVRLLRDRMWDVYGCCSFSFICLLNSYQNVKRRVNITNPEHTGAVNCPIKSTTIGDAEQRSEQTESVKVPCEDNNESVSGVYFPLHQPEAKKVSVLRSRVDSDLRQRIIFSFAFTLSNPELWLKTFNESHEVRVTAPTLG